MEIRECLIKAPGNLKTVIRGIRKVEKDSWVRLTSRESEFQSRVKNPK